MCHLTVQYIPFCCSKLPLKSANHTKTGMHFLEDKSRKIGDYPLYSDTAQREMNGFKRMRLELIQISINIGISS